MAMPLAILRSEGHTAADDHFINLIEHAFDELNFISDLGATKYGKERALGLSKALLK